MEPIENQAGIYQYDDSLIFNLPGSGQSADRCGETVLLTHPSGASLHYLVRTYSCHRKDCPKCWPTWQRRESAAIRDRLQAYYSQTGRMPVHYVLSPPQSATYHDRNSFRDLRKSSYRIGKLRGIRGGCSIFHERASRYRDSKAYERSHCSEGPHFHIIGDGWLNERVKEYFLQDGWIVKNLRMRSMGQVYGTACYILDHAAIASSPDPEPGYPAISQSRRSSMATVTWFGTMAYNRLKIQKFKGSDVIYCPICEEEIPKEEWSKGHWYDPNGPPGDQDKLFGTSEYGRYGIISDGPLTSWSGFY